MPPPHLPYLSPIHPHLPPLSGMSCRTSAAAPDLEVPPLLPLCLEGGGPHSAPPPHPPPHTTINQRRAGPCPPPPADCSLSLCLSPWRNPPLCLGEGVGWGCAPPPPVLPPPPHRGTLCQSHRCATAVPPPPHHRCAPPTAFGGCVPPDPPPNKGGRCQFCPCVIHRAAGWVCEWGGVTLSFGLVLVGGGGHHLHAPHGGRAWGYSPWSCPPVQRPQDVPIVSQRE